MKKLRVLFFVLFILLSFGLFAAPYDMILVGDPALDDLRFLSLATGNAFLSFTPPLSPHEIEIFLDSLDVSLLSAPAKEAYYRLRSRLVPQAPLTFLSSENFSMFINLASTVEVRTRTNEEILWYPQYPDVPHFISGRLRLFFSDALQLFVEPGLTMKTKHYHDETKSFATNASFDYYTNDFHFPFRAFVAAGGSWWNFQLGRDRISWGTGHMGSLSLSDNPDFYEFMRFTFFSRYVKYTSLTMQMPLEITDDLFVITEPDTLWRSMNRYFYMHRLDFNFFDSLSFALMEGVMVGNSPLEIRFLNPLMIFHSFFAWNQYDGFDDSEDGSVIGSFFSVELNWNIIKSLAVYGQFVLNEYSTRDELSKEPNQPPNGLGFLAGIQYNHSFDTWASVFFFEFTSTQPYLYLNPSPFSSFYFSRRTPEIAYAFIGYPRDLIIFTLGAKFFKNDTLNISGDFSFLLNGERDIYYDWEVSEAAFNEKNPSGIVEEKFILSVSAGWKLNSFITLKGRITGIHARNSRHIPNSTQTGIQTALSINLYY